MLMGGPLPTDVVDNWPEVLTGLRLNVVPLMYLQTVLVNFKDGKVWEIHITATTKRKGWSSFEETLSELFVTYGHEIDDLDFKLDMAKVKKDIENSTKKFLRKRKL